MNKKEYVVEKNVPITKNPQRADLNKYPFRHMEVGDSFFVECAKENERIFLSAVYSSAKYYWKEKGHITIRKEGSGFRCWRTK